MVSFCELSHSFTNNIIFDNIYILSISIYWSNVPVSFHKVFGTFTNDCVYYAGCYLTLKYTHTHVESLMVLKNCIESRKSRVRLIFRMFNISIWIELKLVVICICFRFDICCVEFYSKAMHCLFHLYRCKFENNKKKRTEKKRKSNGAMVIAYRWGQIHKYVFLHMENAQAASELFDLKISRVPII